MQNKYPFVNEPLPYSYKEMEPYIDIQTMYIHHDKHLQTYVDNLNHVLKDYPYLQNFSLEQLLINSDRLPQEVRTKIKNNAGGVYNHRFFFQCLANNRNKQPGGRLEEAIKKEYGSIEDFIEKFTQAALSVFGSGYAWLVLNEEEKLKIITTQNQGTPLERYLCPILNLDVWEHAYYLKHFNKRADYIDDWQYVINWEKVEENYLGCMRNQTQFVSLALR